MTELNDTLKAEIILAAVGAAGPGATDQQVFQQVGRIAGFLQPGSPALATFDRLEKRGNTVEKTASFPGTILYVDVEETSQRGVIFFKSVMPPKPGTKAAENYPADGIEVIRTDRLDGDTAESAKALIKAAVGMVGHKALIYKAIENTGSGPNRNLRGLEDQGPNPDYAGLTNEQAAFKIDWNLNNDRKKMLPKLRKHKEYAANRQAA